MLTYTRKLLAFNEDIRGKLDGRLLSSVKCADCHQHQTLKAGDRFAWDEYDYCEHCFSGRLIYGFDASRDTR